MEFPCINCITLGMCKHVKGETNTGGVVSLVYKCSFIKDYLQVKDIFPTPINLEALNSPEITNEEKLITKIQLQRIVEVIDYMGLKHQLPRESEGEK